MTIEGVSTNECPVSLISPFSMVAIQIANRVENMAGVPILGDAHKMPAKFIDALEVIMVERSRVTHAMQVMKATEIQADDE